MTRRLLAFASAVVLSSHAVPVLAQQVVPVAFPAGQAGTTITDTIAGRQYKDYRVNLRAGQRLSVQLTTLRGSPYFNVIEPNAGDVAVYIGSTSGPQADLRTSKSGNYVIRVYQMRNEERRGTLARYYLTINARGGGSTHPGAPSHASGDALVAGTPYHAVAAVRCRTVGGGGFATCKAGVVRRGSSATVHLDTPDGGERTILFRDGRAVSSDSTEPMRVDRRSDTSVIRIGRVEIYEIPDALPFGG